MNAPDWLKLRDGSLRAGLNASTWLVCMNGHPEYRLVAVPANGKSTCVVTQTNNGRRLDGGTLYESHDKALTGGLEELKAKLGW